MGFSGAEEAISVVFSTMATASSLQVVRDNGPEPADKTARWCRLRISGSAAELVSFGGTGRNKYRIRGQVAAEVYAPAKQGAAALREIGDAIGDAFRGVRLTSPVVRFQPPTFGQIQGAETGWARRDVTVPFTFDEEG